MGISNVSLSSSARANLLSLQQTADLLSVTQNRLATGKKVNSALDNATAYFSSQGFLNRANDLSRVKDTLATSLQTVKAASSAAVCSSSMVAASANSPAAARIRFPLRLRQPSSASSSLKVPCSVPSALAPLSPTM